MCNVCVCVCVYVCVCVSELCAPVYCFMSIESNVTCLVLCELKDLKIMLFLI